MRRLLGAALLGLLVWAMGARAVPLTILYTNDIHARLNRLESLGGLIAQQRASGYPVLLLDAGDAWQDFRVPIYAVWGADEMVGWMNDVGYDAMALGNHDLYWGADRLAELSSMAKYPLLCANLLSIREIVPPFFPYVLLETADIQVLVIGLITAEYFPYSDFPWLRRIQPERALAAVLETVGTSGDLIVALGHLSVERACRIAQAVPGIDLFITGHSHEVTPEPINVGETWIVQAGAFGRYLGCLRLDIDPELKDILAIENELLTTEKTSVRWGRGLCRFVETTLLVLGLLLLVLQKR